MQPTDNDIDDFLTAEESAWAGMDHRSFENIANLFEYDPLMALQQVETRIMPMIEGVARQALSFRDVARCLHNPSSIRAAMLFDLMTVKIARSGIPAYLEVFRFYDSALRAICLEDPYAKDGKNIVHSQEEITVKMAKNEPADAGIARSLGKLANACYSLSHGLYSDMYPQLVYENYGPYYQKDGTLRIIKTFGNLKPVDLWPETTSIPYESLELCVHMEGVSMTMDATSHAVYVGSQVDGLRSWSCTADGKKLSLDDIDALRTLIEVSAIDIFQKTKQFSLEERKLFFCRQKAYSCKKIFEALGMDWQPSEKVLNAMRGDELFHGWDIDPDTGSLKVPISAILDPRKEIPKEAFV